MAQLSFELGLVGVGGAAVNVAVGGAGVNVAVGRPGVKVAVGGDVWVNVAVGGPGEDVAVGGRVAVGVAVFPVPWKLSWKCSVPPTPVYDVVMK